MRAAVAETLTCEPAAEYSELDDDDFDIDPLTLRAVDAMCDASIAAEAGRPDERGFCLILKGE